MNKDFKIVGYMPAWKTSKLAKIRYDVLTHVIYSFAYPDEETQELVIPNLDKVNDIIGMAHKENVKVILSVGGWDDFGSSHKDFMLNAVKDDDNMTKLIESIVNTSYDLSFDGIDINWGNLGKDLTYKDEIKLFMEKLSVTLHERSMTLSISVFGDTKDNNDIESYELASCQSDALEYIDWVNVICYESREGVRRTNTNLKKIGKFTESVIIPNEKTVMGVPFFVNVSLMAYQNDIKENRNKDSLDLDVVSCGREIYCLADDEFRSKVNWAKRNAIGLNVWEVTQDFEDKEKSLLSKINEELN